MEKHSLTLLQCRVILKALINNKQSIAWFIDSLPAGEHGLKFVDDNIYPVSYDKTTNN